MAGLLYLIFFAMIALDIWAAVVVIFRPGFGRWLGAMYWFSVILTLAATVAMTGSYSYYVNPNTRAVGWPVPVVVFQRDTPDSPWLDYVGPTVILAYPMNFIIYMAVPSVIFILLALKRRRQARIETEEKRP